MLLVNFHLQRHMGNFLIQVYGPCVLLVVLSWVSFWLNREATADRVSLGITTVLTMTFLGLEARTDLPKVPYPTALDFFVFLSFAFIFATIIQVHKQIKISQHMQNYINPSIFTPNLCLIQFAVVHYFTKYGSGECYFSRDDFDTDSECDEDDAATLQRIAIEKQRINDLKQTAKIFEVIPLATCSVSVASVKRRHAQKVTWLEWPCRRKPETTIAYEPPSANAESGITISSTPEPVHRLSCSSQQVPPPSTKLARRQKRMPRFNSVSKIDRASRVFFPLVFFVINLFYWCLYLTKSERLTTTSMLRQQ